MLWKNEDPCRKEANVADQNFWRAQHSTQWQAKESLHMAAVGHEGRAKCK
jgi:hypothetical protein